MGVTGFRKYLILTVLTTGTEIKAMVFIFDILLPKITNTMLTKLLKKIIAVSKYTLFGLMAQCFLYTVILANSGNAQVKSIEEVMVRIPLQNEAIENAFKAADGFLEGNILARRTGKDLSNVERLGQETLDLTGTGNSQFVVF